jgi:uncharacterized membrane protein YeaQ/YmgE (transglycosylase-associated protein family)
VPSGLGGGPTPAGPEGLSASCRGGTEAPFGAGFIEDVDRGIFGALVGGFLWNLIADEDTVIEFSIGSLIIAVIGALIVSFLFTLITGRRGV